jgi:hypothetical protein
MRQFFSSRPFFRFLAVALEFLPGFHFRDLLPVCEILRGLAFTGRF